MPPPKESNCHVHEGRSQQSSRPKRVRVNAIGPGLIEVPRYFQNHAGLYDRKRDRRWVPWGRVGLPAGHRGRVAVFLSLRWG